PAGGLAQWRVTRAAQGLRRIDAVTGALRHPVRAVIPGAGLLARFPEPLLRTRRLADIPVVARLRIAGWAHQRLDVAAVAEHELAALAQHLGGPVDRPRAACRSSSEAGDAAQRRL